MKFTAFAFVLVLPSAALAQDAPPPVQDWSNTIETVVVTAKRPGPALWHISANGVDVWILGEVSPTPKGLSWNTDEIAGILDGANIVYLPPRLEAGFFEASWFLLTGLGTLKQPDGQTLEGTLPPDLKDRYAAMLEKLGKDADSYADYLALIAAMSLEGDFREHAGLNGSDADVRVERMAHAKDVPTKPLANYQAMPILREALALPAQAQRACLADALDDIDVQAVHASAAARAWAVGDLAGVKANYSEIKLYDCFEQTKSFAADWEHVVDDTVNAVDAALAKPGKSLIVIGMGPLLRKNGVLDRLQARGIKVEGPPG
jgi:uncharacterized protein YbaP (TraB family)